MAELASGAVSSLLGVIRNEALLLGTVRHDVQFIREEMESMQSFLTHLSRKAPADGEHDEQIRTWMNQVRLLAQDSNNCIDMYLYRGNPELHLASGGLRRYIAWLPWFVQKMVAQHRAAIQLRVLRERARDIGERRVRYGVEVPVKEAAVEQSPTAADAVAASVASGDEEEEDNDDQLLVAKEAADHSGLRGAFFEPRTPEDNFRVKLAEWMEEVVRHKSHNRAEEELIPSLAVVAPDKEGTLAIAKEASAMWKKDCTRRQSVLVDIPAVHFYLQWLGTEDILYYILRALQSAEPQRQQQEGQDLGEENLVTDNVKSAISSEKQKLFEEIWEHIQGMKVYEKISEIKSTIKKMKGSQLHLNLTQMNGDELGLLKSTKDEPIGVFLRALWLLRQKSVDSPPATKQGQERKEATRSKMKEAKLSYEYKIKETAKKLKEYMEADTDETPKPKDHIKEEEKERACAKKIHLKEANYEHILREMFPPVTIRKSPQIQEQDSKQATAITTTGTTILLVEDQFKEMIRKILQELQEDKSMKQSDTIVLQEVKSEKKPGTGELLEGEAAKKQEDGADGKPSEDCIPDDLIEETRDMLPEIRRKIYWQLGHKGIMQRIKDCLKRQGHQKILVILKLDNDYVSGWEETRNAFSIIGCIAGVLMLTTEVNMERATEYCCPPREPIHCSLHGLYRDIVLDLTRKQIIGDSLQKIYLDILDKCKQHEFSMKIIVHALYANPRRSNEDLRKLRMTMKQVDKNSFNSIDKKMFKFSYSDLPKDYKSCLLYLSIFPKRQSIRRSTLIGRWVVEGLITKEDWASSVSRANRCFDALVDRWFVYPGDIGSTGEVKSCVIGDLVHGFITKIARKQRIVETRVSHHLARHFSIFNNLRLRRSDKIDRFFQKLYEESFRVSLIKVLDLEGCQCFGGKSRRYIKDICRTMLLLKYLSLRGTNLTQLPSEINNLRELEVLDIRQTSVHESATVNVLLLKLKRLLTGPVVPSSEPGNTKISCVMVPNKIGKMLNMEILSNVKARTSQDLKDIGKLWQLRKLGVVIEHREGGVIRNLIRAISDLHECLKCLTIILPLTEQDRSDEDFPSDVTKYYKQLPRLLESLSITGTTKKGQLLKLLTKHNDLLQLAKITLAGTLLKQADLKVLAKLPKIVCLRLRDKAYMDRELTFREEEFKNLRCFLVEGSNMTNIIFEGGAPHLEKIVLCSTDSLQSLSGVEGLQDLKEVELNNSNKLQLFAQSKNISKVTIRSTTLSQDEVQILTKIPNMLCLVLKENSYAQSHIVFNKDDFPRLSLLIVDFSVTPKISFTVGSAPKLEKIVCSFARNTEDTLSVSGIDILPKLKELEFNGNPVPRELKEALKDNKNKPELVHNKPENQYQETGNIPQRGDAARFPLCWKSQV